MLMEKIIFEDMTKLVTASYYGTWGLSRVGDEGVFTVLIKGGKIDTARYKNGSGDLGDSLKRSLNTIENSLENTYAQQL